MRPQYEWLFFVCICQERAATLSLLYLSVPKHVSLSIVLNGKDVVDLDVSGVGFVIEIEAQIFRNRFYWPVSSRNSWHQLTRLVEDPAKQSS